MNTVISQADFIHILAALFLVLAARIQQRTLLSVLSVVFLLMAFGELLRLFAYSFSLEV